MLFFSEIVFFSSKVRFFFLKPAGRPVKVIKAKINSCIYKRYVFRISRTVAQTVYWLCEQNLYHCNGRITMINFIHFGTNAFWFYTFCQLYVMDLNVNYIFCRAPSEYACIIVKMYLLQVKISNRFSSSCFSLIFTI